VVALAGLSLVAGKVWAPPSAWFSAADPRWAIILELRIPRTVLAAAVGAGLGLCGAAMQGYTRNPLADPGALGVSGVAALAAVLTLFLGPLGQAGWVVSAAAMTGALAATGALLLLSGTRSSITAFLLAGVILQTAAGAGVALALTLAPNPWAVSEIIDWLMGSLADRSVDDLKLALPFMVLGAALVLTLGRALDALSLGETTARSLGVGLSSVRWRLAVGVALVTGASVAVTGIVGFVGLITPHLLRPLVGARPGALLLPSALGGAALVLAADVAVRVAPFANEVRLGAAMAVLGAPFFLALLLRLRRTAA
jgi:iron complex transport system permease protein